MVSFAVGPGLWLGLDLVIFAVEPGLGLAFVVGPGVWLGVWLGVALVSFTVGPGLGLVLEDILGEPDDLLEALGAAFTGSLGVGSVLVSTFLSSIFCN